ncbi:PREDICTED: D site-binding protein [Pseudopodoces humilis]|uniref:D site-binding protein n=1 Tax=Pseudopodoces humilis TaxID=181119 RepID=UPI0006B78B80|nr:PREDICTED: D site-binding protein [Pseudopodoces humilis]
MAARDKMAAAALSKDGGRGLAPNSRRGAFKSPGTCGPTCSRPLRLWPHPIGQNWVKLRPPRASPLAQSPPSPPPPRGRPEELRPQPIARKARKVHVPEEQKDEKYWSRRSRNNAAAKRSRDARRLKENQISVRAAFLERENAALRVEVAAARRELQRFRGILARYEARHGQI